MTSKNQESKIISKVPGEIINYHNARVRVRHRVRVSVRWLVMTVQFMTVQIENLRRVTTELQPPTFWPMPIVIKRLDGSRCHLVWRYVSAQTTLCYMVTQLPHKGHISPQISAGVYCGQMAAWIKIPLGTQVGLSADDIVLDDTYR